MMRRTSLLALLAATALLGGCGRGDRVLPATCRATHAGQRQSVKNVCLSNHSSLCNRLLVLTPRRINLSNFADAVACELLSGF